MVEIVNNDIKLELSVENRSELELKVPDIDKELNVGFVDNESDLNVSLSGGLDADIISKLVIFLEQQV